MPSDVFSNEFFVKVLCAKLLYVVEVAPTRNPHHQGLVESNKTKIAKMVNCQNVHMHVTIHLVEVIVVVKVVVIFDELI